MIGFKINVCPLDLRIRVGIHIATFIKREFLFSVFEAISVIAPGNKQNYTKSF